ncbi:MAG: ribonuclease D [Mastigocoleus sp.]
MPYLTSATDISSLLVEFSNAKTLWIDTEVADYKSRKPRLSLIQILDDAHDMSGERSFIFDVLEQPDIVDEFVEQVMVNSAVEKVFHNAKYDLRFLGGKKVKNVTCTLELAKSIPYYILPLPNYQLKTLATELCQFQNIDKEQQGSDWGIRPLSEEQVEYAYLDCIYLAQVHLQLLEIQKQVVSDPKKEDLVYLGSRYTELEEDLRLLKSEFEHLQERIKSAMQIQNVSETADIELKSSERTTMKVAFGELAKVTQKLGINLDFPVNITQKLRKDLGGTLEKLPVEIDKITSLKIVSKKASTEE